MSPPIQVIFLAPTPSQPRYHRRIQACLDRGYQVTVCSFRRGLYEVNELPPGIRHLDLGPLRGGNYLQRLIPLLKAVLIIRPLLAASAHPLVYCFGLDCALLGLLARRAGTRLVYEVADLIYLMPHQGRLVRKLMAALDRQAVRKSHELVVTSEGFVQHYRNLVPGCLPLVIENKVSALLRGTPRPVARCPGTPLRIGVIGLIYYLDCLQPLLDFAASRDGFEVHFYGDGPDLAAIHAAAARHPDRIFYHGPFRNPADLFAVYDRMDFSYVVYPPDDENVRLLTPNKLYESLWFGCPLIVADNTLLAERVRSLGIGYAIDGHRIGPELERIFTWLRGEDHSAFCQRALAVPDEMLLDESDRLMALLTEGLAGEGR